MTSNLTEEVSFRPYKHIDDAAAVREMCRSVYGGTDWVPRSLEAYDKDPLCYPQVMAVDVGDGSKVIAFCNPRRYRGDAESREVVYIEAVRVAESARGRRLGTRLLEESMNAGRSATGAGQSVRFLSVSVSWNEPMCRIFTKLGWACRGTVEMWPQNSIVYGADCSKRGFLDVLGLSEHIPIPAREAVRHWEALRTPQEILSAMRELRGAGGCFLVPQWYAVDTAGGASVFLESVYSAVENRSAWLLTRSGKPPALLFGRERCVEPSKPSVNQTWSACVVDVEAAECCVAFVDSRVNTEPFHVIFDPAISSIALQTSVLLSRVPTTPYLLYETKR